MQHSLLGPCPVPAGTWQSTLRLRPGDDGLSRLAVSRRRTSDDAAGRFFLKTVGPGLQTLHYGDGCLIAYVAFSAFGPAYEQYAIDNGGAAIIYQRDDVLETESLDGRFAKICRATTSWFLDQIHVAGGAIRRSVNVFRGDGGPVTMSDGTLALAHISGIHWSTLHAIGQWADEEVRRRRLRGDRRREFKQRMLSDGTRGRIGLNLEVRFYLGQPDGLGEDFHRGDYQELRYLLAPVELGHKPFTASVPAVWRQEFTTSAQAAVRVAWDFCDPADPLIAVAGSGLTNGPQRPGREPHEDAEIWVFGEEGR